MALMEEHIIFLKSIIVTFEIFLIKWYVDRKVGVKYMVGVEAVDGFYPDVYWT